jgi:hypothetical protein
MPVEIPNNLTGKNFVFKFVNPKGLCPSRRPSVFATPLLSKKKNRCKLRLLKPITEKPDSSIKEKQKKFSSLLLIQKQI